VTSCNRVYLDNAATSWPKPEAVYAAVDRYQRQIGCSPARGVYAEAKAADEEVEATRRAVAGLIGAKRPEQIVFTLNCSDALNMALHGLLRTGDHVVTSVVDHNSVLRPLRWLSERLGIEITRVCCDGEGILDPKDVARALRDNTRLVALVHASNVTGALQPIEEVGRLICGHGALFLVDAAQSAGHLPMTVDGLGADLLAAPGHKGLLGPLGTGLLYIREGVENRLESFRQGGTGTHSDLDLQPSDLPDKYEPGNHNVPGICGLRAGIEYLRERGVENVRQHEQKLTLRLLDGLAPITGVRVYGPRSDEKRVGVVSMTHPEFAPAELATRLDAEFRVQCRAGIHCAPHMHETLGTMASGGTLRFSLGPFTTADEIDRAVRAVAAVVR
jgi:cysteine desulfurase family protein